MKFTIERAKWLHGEGATPSFLLRRSDHKKCCLGFFAMACGIDRELLLEVAIPRRIKTEKFPEEFKFLLFDAPTDAALIGSEPTDSEIADALMDINDDPDITEVVREARISQIFKDQGIEVQFV